MRGRGQRARRKRARISALGHALVALHTPPRFGIEMLCRPTRHVDAFVRKSLFNTDVKFGAVVRIGNLHAHSRAEGSARRRAGGGHVGRTDDFAFGIGEASLGFSVEELPARASEVDGLAGLSDFDADVEFGAVSGVGNLNAHGRTDGRAGDRAADANVFNARLTLPVEVGVSRASEGSHWAIRETHVKGAAAALVVDNFQRGAAGEMAGGEGPSFW